MEKVMIYLGENDKFFGYKKVNTNIKAGTNILVNEKFAKCISVVDLSEEAFYLLKVLFGELKHRRISNREKVSELMLYIKDLSNESLVRGHYDKLMNAIERREMMLDSVVERI